MMCGTPVAQPQAQTERRRQHADPETVRFLRAVISRPATFTFVFIVANVFLYLLMWYSGGANGEVLLAFGAKRNDLVNAGQWWRFVTPVFLHVHLPGLGPMHLIANMYGLFMLGPFVEKLYGSARFVVFWILTGVAGVFASYLTVNKGLADGALGQFLFKGTDSPSAGASGALFGLIGVLFVFGLKYRHELPEGLKPARAALPRLRRAGHEPGRLQPAEDDVHLAGVELAPDRAELRVDRLLELVAVRRLLGQQGEQRVLHVGIVPTC